MPVVLPSLLSMHCHAQKVASLPSGTMRPGIIQLISFQKSAQHNVSVEPHLQPITGEFSTSASANFQDGARLDVAADGSWVSCCERLRAFRFDVKVFNPTPPQIDDLLHTTVSMRLQRNKPTREGSSKLTMPPLLCIWRLRKRGQPQLYEKNV